ncbi:MAG: DUF4091 domain-containing protein [Clostridia bacterium]|nr:DUF4091 domain-containing protein [Clostridia bacterium]
MKKPKYNEAYQNIKELESVPLMDIWCRHGYETVYRHTLKSPFDSPVLTLTTGQNMTVTAQIFLRHKSYDFSVERVYWEGLGDGITMTLYRQEYDTFSDGLAYPDRLSEECTGDFKRFATQGWLAVLHTAPNAKAGQYIIKIHFETKFGTQTAQLILRVYPVSLPEPADCSGLHEYYFQYHNTDRVGGQKLYTDAWWTLMKNYAESMKGMRINSLYLDPCQLLTDAGSRRISRTEWHFEFSLLDRMIDVFLENGSFFRIALAAMTVNFSARWCDAPDEQGNPVRLDLDTEEGEGYFRALYSALYRHFREKDMLDLIHVHLCDEIRNPEGWLKLCRILRECWPDAVTSEPMDDLEVSMKLAGAVNEFMPRIDVFEEGRSFYMDRLEEGDVLRCYSCCFPDDPIYLNKFSNQPHSYAQMIHWALVPNHISGFMHWGFNHWDPNYQYEGHPYKGDAYIVYPSPDGRVLPSYRYFSTVEGVEMYELLKRAESFDAEFARALASSVADTFHSFREQNITPARTALFEYLTAMKTQK